MSKKRDREYDPKPQDVELKREDLPPSPAKLSRNYCKKGKDEHQFELEGSIRYSRAWSMKTYRCAMCNKIKRVLKRQDGKEQKI